MIGINFYNKLCLPVLYILIFSIFAFPLQAKTPTANFLQAEIGPDIAGLAGSVSFFNKQGWLLFYNPAGLSLVDEIQTGISHIISVENIYFEGAYISFPMDKVINRKDVIAVGLLYKHFDLLLTDKGGELTGEQLSPKDFGLLLGYSLQLNLHLSLGISFKYIKSIIEPYSGSTFAGDIGFFYKTDILSKPLILSLSIQNIGTKMKMIQKEEPLPLIFRSDISLNVLKAKIHSINLIFSGNKNYYFPFRLNVGYEHFINKIFVYRIGYKLLNDDLGWITVGAGVHYKNYSFNYAYQPLIKFGAIHQAGFGIKF